MSAPILLFDIDGTLVRGQGAGSRAMDRAFRGLFGFEDPRGNLSIAGRSDSWIVARVFERHGVAASPADVERFIDAYVPALHAELSASDGLLLPGIEPLLEALAERDAVVGLGTGNFRRSAMAKLNHFGIGRYFADGGFGDDAADRGELLAAGVARLRRRTSAAAEVVVIGDTEHDVYAGHAIGARVVAVETGFATGAQLQDAGADVLLTDCADLEAALDAILGRAAG